MNRRQAKKELNKWFYCNSLLRKMYNKRFILKTFKGIKKCMSKKYKFIIYEELKGDNNEQIQEDFKSKR